MPAFVVIPAIAVTMIVALIGLVVLFGLSLVPEFNAMLWGAILLIAGIFLPQIIVYESRKLKLTINSILAMSGLLAIFIGLFGASIGQFFAGLGSIAGSITGAPSADFGNAGIILLLAIIVFYVGKIKKAIK